MSLLNPKIEETKVVTPWLWILGFGLAPWIVLYGVGIACRGLWPYLTSTAAQWAAGAGLLWLGAFAVLVYEQWFGELAWVILQKNYDPQLDAANYQNIYPPLPMGDTTVEEAVKAVAAAATPEQKRQAAAAGVQIRVDAALKDYQTDLTQPASVSGATDAVAKVMGWFTQSNELRFTRMKYVLDRLQLRIGEEYTDISSRIGWLMTGQAFLLGAFATILNAERLGDEAKHWFSTGVAFSGAVISLVLTLSTFFGHALIRKLKKPRDEAEAIMQADFHVPRAGVPVTHSAHKLGHAATRYLPTFAYVAWACLALLAGTSQLTKQASNDDQVSLLLLPYEALTRPDVTRGWTLYSRSAPPFPVGGTTYAEANKACPDNSKAAEEWMDAFITAWSQRPAPSAVDGLVVVGSADRVSLSEVFKRKLDSNMSLARGRAEEIKRLLIAQTKRLVDENKLAPQHRISAEHVMVLVTGPRNAALGTPASNGKPDCKNPELAADRTVQVWIPSRD